MRCYECGKGMAEGVSLFRQNPKGEAGIWACEQHSEPIDEEVLKVSKIIEQNDNPDFN